MNDQKKYKEYRGQLVKLRFLFYTNRSILVLGSLFLIVSPFWLKEFELITPLISWAILIILFRKFDNLLKDRIKFMEQLVVLYKIILKITLTNIEQKTKEKLIKTLSTSHK